MPSLRKRVSSYFRQLSFHNEPREKRFGINENSFVIKYLQGLLKLQEGPPVISGKTPTDLPNYDLGTYKIGPESIVGCHTGPNGGLATVKRTEKHLSIAEAEIDFIDVQEENVTNSSMQKSRKNVPIDNSTMVIKVGGQEYFVTSSKKHKSHSLGSLSDLNTDQEENKIEINTNKGGNGDDLKSAETNLVKNMVKIPVERQESLKERPYELSKSKSEGNPFRHKKRGRIIRVERPNSTVSAASDVTDASSLAKPDLLLPIEWNRTSDHVYGLSDSLYDKNLITKLKNGDPIADCFGIIAREDSAVLAVADGVNWGEKACIAAKSAVHGSLHYLNKTIFNDTKPFETFNKSETYLNGRDVYMTDTRDVFVSLLRAFNCAHDLILENEGMLTTLTVAVILPLKDSKDNFICCCCNVGDTLAYVYSQRYGVREITKGSHDVLSNRDMRDALGALGPVDGINPELSNLTLSVTKVQKGDIVFIASDGLTDNFDASVCKFAVNLPSNCRNNTKVDCNDSKMNSKIDFKLDSKINSKIDSKLDSKINSKIDSKLDSVKEMKIPPIKPPRKNLNQNKNLNQSKNLKNPHSQSKNNFNRTLSNDDSITTQKPTNYNFLRSKTSIDLRPQPKTNPIKVNTIQRNPDGLPYVSPIQRYDLALLLMEDILKNGISGRENRCVTARKLCESLMGFTMSITAAKRRTLEDNELYFDNRNGLLVEVTSAEKKSRRKRAIERVQNLPGKLDHVTVVGVNVGDFSAFR